MEIFAPAGNLESLKQAVQHGADCVYLGLDKFNARMAADNFTKDNFKEVVDFCHLFNVKVYLTLNVLIKPSEFDSALDLASFAYYCGVDGIICADLGLTSLLAKNLPECDIVLSTQANVQNADGCKIAQELGINSVVLSREIDRNTILDIRKKFPTLNLEYFVQGALCVCVSGQCQLSSSVDCYSGNRGQCKQPCRQRYKSYSDGRFLNDGYLLSTRDLSLVDKIQDLKQLGINRIKIEGRNRRKEYVGQAVEVYKKAIDENIVSAQDKTNLKKMFNRGDYTDGYLYTTDTNQIMYPYVQGHKGIECSKISGIKNIFCEAVINNAQKGDAYKIFRNNLEVGSAICIDTTGKKAKLTFKGSIKVNDKLHITSDSALLAEYSSFDRKLPVELIVYAFEGQLLKCVCKCKDTEFTYCSDFICQKAVSQALSNKEIALQLSKMGNTYFTIADIIVKNDEVFIPKSQLNEFRRNLISELIIKLTENYRKKLLLSIPSVSKKAITQKQLAVCISSAEQIDSVFNCNIIIVKPENYSTECLKKFDRLNSYYLDLPNFALKCDTEVLRPILKNNKIIGICANSLYAIQLAKEFNKKLLLGQGMNIFNDYTATLFGNDVDFIYSNELTLNEIDEFENKNGYIYAEGFNCCMTLAHCPIQLNYKCKCNTCKYNGDITYKDNFGNELLIKRKKISKCYFEVFNTHRLSAYKKIDGNHNFFLNLCGFNADDTKQTVKLYKDLIDKNEKSSVFFNEKTTNGHLYKNVK